MTVPTLDDEGFCVTPDVVDMRTVERLRAAIDHTEGGDAVRSNGRTVYAIRGLMSLVPVVEALEADARIRSLVTAVLGQAARCVRGIFFDKSPGANWKVAWHQDLSIAVKERRTTPGFGPWSVKAGVVHVQPPLPMLERMLTLRLHLDPCDTQSGPLRVLPGSHRRGVLTPEAIAALRQSVMPFDCVTSVGGVLMMRPLLLHASNPATGSSRRRVIHLEWSADELPNGLIWAERRGPPGRRRSLPLPNPDPPLQ